MGLLLLGFHCNIKISAPQDPEELQSVDEDLDSLLANVEYIQGNIVELQNDLIAVDDSKVGGGVRGWDIPGGPDIGGL